MTTPDAEAVAALAEALSSRFRYDRPEFGGLSPYDDASRIDLLLHAAGWTLSRRSEREAADGWLKSALGHLVDARSLHADNSDINAADLCIEKARAAIEGWARVSAHARWTYNPRCGCTRCSVRRALDRLIARLPA